MSGPTSPRGWFCWAESVAERYRRPHGPRFEHTGRTDPRVDDRRETAISVQLLAERASHTACGNGVGYALLLAYFVEEVSWYSLTENERRLFERTLREFKVSLAEAGFL